MKESTSDSPCCRCRSFSEPGSGDNYCRDGFCLKHRRSARRNDTCPQFKPAKMQGYYNHPVKPVDIFVGE